MRFDYKRWSDSEYLDSAISLSYFDHNISSCLHCPGAFTFHFRLTSLYLTPSMFRTSSASYQENPAADTSTSTVVLDLRISSFLRSLIFLCVGQKKKSQIRESCKKVTAIKKKSQKIESVKKETTTKKKDRISPVASSIRVSRCKPHNFAFMLTTYTLCRKIKAPTLTRAFATLEELAFRMATARLAEKDKEIEATKNRLKAAKMERKNVVSKIKSWRAQTAAASSSSIKAKPKRKV